MRYPISKLIWAGLIIALIFLGAMFILPVVGAVLIRCVCTFLPHLAQQ